MGERPSDETPPPAPVAVKLDLPKGVGAKTDPAMVIANPAYVNRKVAEAVRAGRVTGIAGIVVAVGLAFGGWFKIEAMAQEKAAAAVAVADAGTDRKIAPIATDIAVLKNDVSTLKDDVGELKKAAKDNAETQREVLRLLRRRDRE